MSQRIHNYNYQPCYQTGVLQQQENIGQGQVVVRISQDRLQIEMNIYQKLQINKCLNVVEILKIFNNQVIIEECSMTLDQFMKKRLEISLGFSRQDIQLIIAQIINGYQHLKQLGIIYRNLTPQTILIKQIKGRFIIKLSDFSLSGLVNNQELAQTKAGIPVYWAPEVMFQPEKGYNDKCDIFSLGIILHQLCFQNQMPQLLKNSMELQTFLMNLKQQQFKCQKGGDIDQEYIDLIEKMIVFEPRKRISWEELARIPIFQQPYKLLDNLYIVDFTHKLGSGMQGVIYLTIDLRDQKEFCAKVIDNTQIEGQREISVYEKLSKNNSKNIIQIYNCFHDKHQTYVILEKCDEDIKQYFEKNNNVNNAEILDFLDQITNGYMELQKHGIIHRDLKPENILIKYEDNKKKIKIIDFGVSKINTNQELATTLAGTPIYSAPEVLTLTGKGYTNQCDIYSLGTMLYQFVYKQPYCQANTLENLKNFQQQLKKNPFICPQKSVFKQLIERMLIYDPNQRISWTELQEEVKNLMSKLSIKITERESILHESISSSILRYLDSLQLFTSKLEQELINFYDQQTKYKTDVAKLLYFLLFFSQATILDCQEIITKQAIYIGGETFKQEINIQWINQDRVLQYIDDLQEYIEQIKIEPDQYFVEQQQKMFQEIENKRMTCYDIHQYFNAIFLMQKYKTWIQKEVSIKLRYFLLKLSNIFQDYPLSNVKAILYAQLAEKIKDENVQKKYLETRWKY
ncbi:unnamed protein product [Paramecium sonneborni]|uniref:Protein kinase domain-containing protein n=1 Tax=Paramecium sonneborni TaxID=65129 RepID=A0A8S1NZE3_9CILI|nr:unnamed protein product [Paramecium sonneborni]